VTETLNPILFSSWCRISKMAIVFVPDHSDPNAVILSIIYLNQCRFLALNVVCCETAICPESGKKDGSALKTSLMTHSGSGAANFAVPYKTVLPSDMLECRPQPEDKARETAL
jgi:hypothetical protein